MYLCVFCTNNPTKWVQFLPSTKFHHNSAPHSLTKISPFSLLYGYEPCSYPILGKTFLPALKEWLSWLKEAQKEALTAHNSAQKLMTSRTTHHLHPWKVGDKVWLEATHLRLHYPSWKLTLKRHGPFEIIQVLSPLTYKLWLPFTWRIHDVFHTSLLSSYHSTELYGPASLSLPPDVIDNEEEHKVKAIHSHQGPSNWRLYLTTWKGYPSSENI